MSQITEPAVLALCEPGETAWEWYSEDQVALQRDCPLCDKGLLYTPVRFCPACSGHGKLIRIVAAPSAVTED